MVYNLDLGIYFSDMKLQVLPQIIAQCRHQNVFVGGLHASGVHFLHIVVVDQRSQHRLYRAAPAFGEESRVISVPVQLLMHGIV